MDNDKEIEEEGRAEGDKDYEAYGEGKCERDGYQKLCQSDQYDAETRLRDKQKRWHLRSAAKRPHIPPLRTLYCKYTKLYLHATHTTHRTHLTHLTHLTHVPQQCIFSDTIAAVRAELRPYWPNVWPRRIRVGIMQLAGCVAAGERAAFCAPSKLSRGHAGTGVLRRAKGRSPSGGSAELAGANVHEADR